jgi:hypothetical protein
MGLGLELVVLGSGLEIKPKFLVVESFDVNYVLIIRCFRIIGRWNGFQTLSTTDKRSLSFYAFVFQNVRFASLSWRQ